MKRDDSKIKMIKYRCKRCKHKWFPRKEEKPIICPRCKSPYWNKLKKSPKETEVMKRGTLAKY